MIIRTKEDTLGGLKELIAEIEEASGKHRVQKIKMDNGDVFSWKEARDWLRNRVIYP